jgi:hypothetical protein
VSTIKINRLNTFSEIIVVYCENHMKKLIHSVGKMQSFSMLKRVVAHRTTGL